MRRPNVIVSAVIGAMLLGIAPSADAQDSFGAVPAAPIAPVAAPNVPSPVLDSAPPATGRQQSATGATQMSGSAEMQDFGVNAQDTLRPTEALHAPTPTSVPGARTIDTQTLASMLRDSQRQPLVFHVLGSPEHLPGAIAATPAGQGGTFEDAAQRQFGEFLKSMSRDDASMPMVFYCGGTHCWMSYNAALRAVHLGYRNVAWYRGGIEAWRNAGLPLEGVGNGAPAFASDRNPQGIR